MFSFTKRFEPMKSIIDMIPFYLYAGEDAMGGGEAPAPDSGGSADAGNDTIPLPEVGAGIPQEFLDAYSESDPEIAKAIKKEKPAKADDDTSPEDHTDTTKDDDKNSVEDDTEAGEGKEKDDQKLDDDKNSVEDDDNALDFADDVIEGLKGEHLKALPKEARLALAEFYAKHSEISTEHKSLKERLEGLESDPVVKLREDLLKKGQKTFDVRGITVKEKESLVARIQNKIGLSKEEAEVVFNEVEESVKAIAAEQAEDVLNNRVIEADQTRKSNETIGKGRSIFLQLGKFNKALAFKETDGNKFWRDTGKVDEQGRPIFEPDSKHPEAKLYAEKIIPIIQTLGKAGINYGMLVKLHEQIGVDGIYAMVAKQHGLPVAINTGERDKKMLQSELRKKLSPFLRSESSPELTAGSGKAKPTPSAPTIKHGFDIVKLATDLDYNERAKRQKPGDLQHAKLIERLSEEGDAYIANKTKK